MAQGSDGGGAGHFPDGVGAALPFGAGVVAAHGGGQGVEAAGEGGAVGGAHAAPDFGDPVAGGVDFQVAVVISAAGDPDGVGMVVDDQPVDELRSERGPAPDAYNGLLTATKMWWMVAGMRAIAAGNVYIFFDSGKTNWLSGGVGATFLVFFAVVLGIGDASWGYRIARGQSVQFVVVSIVTVGTFAVIYLASYGLQSANPCVVGSQWNIAHILDIGKPQISS